MTDFVEQCRREWKRLRVPDPIAEEMAADLAADLSEAEAEGVPAEQVLGSGAFDPRSFAASWAAERGVIPAAAPPAGAARRPFVLGALATLTVVVLGGAAFLALPLRSGSVAVAPQPPAHLAPPAHSGPFGVQSGPFAVEAGAWILLLLVAVLAVAAAAWLWSGRVRLRPPAASA